MNSINGQSGALNPKPWIRGESCVSTHALASNATMEHIKCLWPEHDVTSPGMSYPKDSDHPAPFKSFDVGFFRDLSV